MKILVDMDGVLADFESGFLKLWREAHPEKIFIPVEQRTTFYVAAQYPVELKDFVREIYTAPGFFRWLEPIEGGAEALNQMQEMGHEVFICTSPLTAWQNCVLEKYEWVDAHLGPDWVGRIILAKDKTMVAGDILIDDRPRMEGCATPSWEHVLYDQPYNRMERDKRWLTWSNWKSVLN